MFGFLLSGNFNERVGSGDVLNSPPLFIAFYLAGKFAPAPAKKTRITPALTGECSLIADPGVFRLCQGAVVFLLPCLG